MPEGDITDFTELVDVGSNFDPKTGRLTINNDEQNGYYVFHISAYKSYDNGKLGDIRAFRNHDVHPFQSIFEYDVENDLMMNSVVTSHLQNGDKVILTNGYSDSVYVDSIHPSTFTGYKIQF